MHDEEKELVLLEVFLVGLSKEIEDVLSSNMAISLYDIMGEFYSDEKKFELKIAAFFAGMPDKLMFLHKAVGDISIIRHEIMKGGQSTYLKQRKMEEFFTNKSAQLNKRLSASK